MRPYPEVGETYGRYVVRRRIGRGGMGAVFEAEEQPNGRSVALKVLAPDLSDEETFRRRFVQEAATLIALDSPHVITLYDYGDVDGSLFIAMQLVAGRDLAQLLLDDGALDPEQALEVSIQIADALADAHATGLVHRDVKPSNALVRYIRGEPFVYLCDFGIAKSEQSPHTRTRGVIGTFEYMAPERHLGADADQRSDVYSLGCLLWAALSGQAPYQGTSEVQVAMAHLQKPIPQVDPALPAAASLQAVVSQAMAKEPAERYQSAAAMRAALRDAQDDVRRARRGPAAARPPHAEQTVARGGAPLIAAGRTDTPPPEGGRWGVLVATLAAVILVVAVAGAGVALVRHADKPAKQASAKVPPTDTSSTTARRSSRNASTRPKASKSGTGTKAPSAPSAVSTPSPTAAASSPSASPTAGALVCWDGARVAAANDCSTPEGTAGMASVFPSFDHCGPAATTVRDKVEVYECKTDRITIRYSRWNQKGDRPGYLDKENPGADKGPWVLGGGEVSGTTWTSFESERQDPTEDMRYQWSATYTNKPFEVSVEGRTEADRETGEAEVQAKPESQVGLR